MAEKPVEQPQIVNPFASDYTPPKGAFRKGLSAGTSSLKATAGGVAAAIGDATGLDSVKQYGLDVAKSANEESAKDAMSVEDIGSVGDAADFVKYGVGYSIPNVLASIAGGVIGKLGGSVAAKGVADASTQLFLKNAGMTAGILGNSLAQEVGSIYPEAVESGVDSPLTRSIVGGVAAAGLDAAPELFLAHKAGLLGKGINPTSRLKSIAGTAGKSALLEGATEVGQTAIERTAAGQSLTDSAAISDYLNSGALGVIGGGASGSIAGAVGPVGSQTTPEAVGPVGSQTTPEAQSPVTTQDITTDGISTPNIGTQDVESAPISAPESNPIVDELAQKSADNSARRTDIQSRLGEIESEEKLPLAERRTKQEITNERKSLNKELEQTYQNDKNYELQKTLPEYQAKTRLATPVEINATAPTDSLSNDQAVTMAQLKPEFQRTAEDLISLSKAPKAVVVPSTDPTAPPSIEVRQDNNVRSRLTYDSTQKQTEEIAMQIELQQAPSKIEPLDTSPVIPDAASLPDTPESIVIKKQSAEYKRSNGLLMSSDEIGSLSVDTSDKPTPRLVLPTGGKPRVSVKQADVQAQREFIKSTGDRVAEAKTKEFVDNKLIKEGKQASTVRAALSKAVSTMLDKSNPQEAKAHLEQQTHAILKGKVNKVDINTAVDSFVSEVLNTTSNFSVEQDKALTDKGTTYYSKSGIQLEPLTLDAKSKIDPTTLDQVLTQRGSVALNYLDRIIGNPNKLEVRTFNSISPNEGAGTIKLNNAKDVIELAINAQDMLSVAAHEGFHYLEHRALNVSEQSVIKNAFAPGSEMYNRLIAQSRQYDSMHGTDITSEIESVPAEARAYGYEFWRRGELEAKSVLGRAFDKIKNIASRIANLVRGLGFQSHEDIFDAVNKGYYAQQGISPLRSFHVNDVPADSGTLVLKSKSSLEDMVIRAKNGEIPTTQLHALVSDMIDNKSVPTDTREKLFREGSSQLQGAADSLKRGYLEHISSGENLSRRSAGYNNVFKVLTTYTQRKNRLISDNIENRLSTWIKGSTSDDRSATSKALLERTVGGFTKGSAEYNAMYSKMTEAQRTMFNQATDMIAYNLDKEFEAEKIIYAKSLGAETEAYSEWIANRSVQVQQLKERGYFPERRYGDHAVHAYITSADGKKLTVYYSQHERESEARNELGGIQRAFSNDPSVKVEYGYKYKADYDGSLSMQQFIDLANRNGVELSQEEKQRLAKALISADSTRRNRIFKRQNIAGFSENGQRILAEFGVSMANKIAYSELGDALNASMAGQKVDTNFNSNGTVNVNIDDTVNTWANDGELSGFYHNLADKTADFVMSPREGSKISSTLRAAATIQFLGGSISAGVVQLSSLPMNTVPWLTQHTNYTNALSKVASAFKTTVANHKALTDLPTVMNKNIAIPGIDEVEGLRDAMIIAAQDGTTLDTEIHQIMGLSKGQEYSYSGKVAGAIKAWMTPFRLTEQWNRNATFIASFKIAKENNLDNAAAYKQAQEAVYGTQFRYDDANRPAIARGPVGSLLFTFKSYPIFMTETIVHLAKENKSSAVFMLLSLAAFSGLEGLPFAEDMEDLIDTIAFRVFGSSFNSKRALMNTLKSASEAVVGADLSSVGIHGIANSLTDLNIASRVGMGNIIPGTRMGLPDADFKSVVQEVAGPTMSMTMQYLNGLDSLSKGNYEAAMRQALPLAAQNVVKGAQQFQSGFAQDISGRKLVDVTGMQAFFQSLGFSPTALSRAYDLDRMNRQSEAFYNEARKDFSNNLTKAITEKDTGKITEIINTITEWNKSNPDMVIAISPASIRKEVQQAGLTLESRSYLALPKHLRNNSATALGLDENK